MSAEDWTKQPSGDWTRRDAWTVEFSDSWYVYRPAIPFDPDDPKWHAKMEMMYPEAGTPLPLTWAKAAVAMAYCDEHYPVDETMARLLAEGRTPVEAWKESNNPEPPILTVLVEGQQGMGKTTLLTRLERMGYRMRAAPLTSPECARGLAEGAEILEWPPSTPGDQHLLEELAALEHDQWAHWTRYMLKVLEVRTDGHCASCGYTDIVDVDDHASDCPVGRWERQIETPYALLSEGEKESDREWARKVMAQVASLIDAPTWDCVQALTALDKARVDSEYTLGHKLSQLQEVASNHRYAIESARWLVNSGLQPLRVRRDSRLPLRNRLNLIYARISDSELDEDCWTTWALLLDDGGTVVKVFEIPARDPAYEVPWDGEGYERGEENEPLPLFRPGVDLDRLLLWAARDPTGEHPEIYHELSYDPSFEPQHQVRETS